MSVRSKYIVAGYAENGSLPNITEEDARKLTHLNVAFGHVRDAEIRTEHLNHLAVLRQLKRWNPGLKLLLSVGGWGAGGFSEAAFTREGRRRMADTAVRVLNDHPFDGIDLDWEYPCYAEAGIQAAHPAIGMTKPRLLFFSMAAAS